MLFCSGVANEHIGDTARRAIEMARKYNRKVWFNFNGWKMVVNKRLSERHVVRTYLHMTDAWAIRYFKKESQEQRDACFSEMQERPDALMLDQSKGV